MNRRRIRLSNRAAMALLIVAAGASGCGAKTGLDAGGTSGGPATASARSGKIAANAQESCFLSPAGTVRCWGDNEFGQLGIGSTTGPQTCQGPVPCSTRPVAVSGLTDAVDIAVSEDLACALRSDGTVACWGTPPQADTCPYGPYACETTPATVKGLDAAATAIVAGLGSACALLANGEVECWGQQFFSDIIPVGGTSDTNPQPVPGN